MDRSKLAVAHEYADRIDAELAVATLSEAGINAMIQSDSVGGMRDHLAWSGAGFKVLVLDPDLDSAREILEPRVTPEIEDFGSAPGDPGRPSVKRLP